VSYWRLVAPSGEQFGHRLWVDISVTEMESKEETEEAVASAAPSPLATSSNLGAAPKLPDVPPPAKTETVLEVLSGGAAAVVDKPAVVASESLDSDKWEEVEAPTTPTKQFSASNPFLGSENDEDEDNFGDAEELSASIQGAAVAGSVLHATGLTDSVAAVVEASHFDQMLTKWSAAVTKITDMGFDDVPTIIALLEKHATPDNFDTKLQVIVGELLSGMPVVS
jgi:hypothetical protein